MATLLAWVVLLSSPGIRAQDPPSADELRSFVTIPAADLPAGVQLKPHGRGSPFLPLKRNPGIIVDRRAFPMLGLWFGMTEENDLREVERCVVAIYFEEEPRAELGVYGLWFSSRVAADARFKRVKQKPDGSRFIAKGNLLLRVWRDPGVSDAAMNAVVAHLEAAKLDGSEEEDTRPRVTSFRCKGGVFAVAISPDGKWVATGESDGVSVRDSKSGKVARRYPNRGTVHAARFSPDGRHLAWGGFGNSFAIVDLAKGEKILEPDVGICVGFFTSYSADGTLLLSDGGNGRGNRTDQALLWNVPAGKLLRRFEVDGTLKCGVLTPDGETVVTGDDQGRILFWEAKTGRRRGEVRVDAPAVPDLAIDAKGATVAAVSSAPVPYVSIIDVARRAEVKRIPRERVIRAVALTGDGQRVAVAGNERGIEIHDVATGAIVRKLAGHRGGCSSLVFNAGATMLLSGGFDGGAVLWQIGPPTDGAQIMRRVVEAYAGCRTYRDRGTSSTDTFDAKGKAERRQRATFSTAFVRPDRFRFEFKTTRRDEPDRYVIWTDGKRVERRWDLRPDDEQPESLESALSVATGVTMGASTVISSLLIKDEPWGEIPRDWKRLEDEAVEGVDCFRVRNRSKALNFDDGSEFDVVETYWVAKETFAVHRVVTEMSLPSMRCLTTITLSPAMDAEVPEDALRLDRRRK